MASQFTIPQAAVLPRTSLNPAPSASRTSFLAPPSLKGIPGYTGDGRFEKLVIPKGPLAAATAAVHSEESRYAVYQLSSLLCRLTTAYENSSSTEVSLEQEEEKLSDSGESDLSGSSELAPRAETVDRDETASSFLLV